MNEADLKELLNLDDDDEIIIIEENQELVISEKLLDRISEDDMDSYVTSTYQTGRYH